MVSDSWFPGWSASVDGSAVAILRANGIVRGLYVPAGRHEVEMRYWPRSFRLGCSVSLATVAGLGVSLLVARLKRRARQKS